MMIGILDYLCALETKNAQLEELVGKVIVSREFPKVKNVIYKDNHTIVLFKDGTKTISVCDKKDTFSPQVGFTMCLCKRLLGNQKYRKLVMQYAPYEDSPKGSSTDPQDIPQDEEAPALDKQDKKPAKKDKNKKAKKNSGKKAK